MIEYPMPGRYMLALLTNETVDDARGGTDDFVVVFVPSNHLHLGHPVIVPRAHAHPVDMTPVAEIANVQDVLHGVSARELLHLLLDPRHFLQTELVNLLRRHPRGRVGVNECSVRRAAILQ